MHDEAVTDGGKERSFEIWTIAALATTAAMAVAWIAVFLRLGTVSVYAHGAVIPVLGYLTTVVFAWGIIWTLFNPPIFRRNRTIAFLLLLATGYLGKVPFITVPLATEDYVSMNAYELPVRGGWSTVAGGDKATNYHATSAAARWGYDFTRTVDGRKFQLDGITVTDWYCFGEPVYAPVGGRIVQATSRYVDNPPGEISGADPLGNFVVIEAPAATGVGAPDKEYVFIAHLQKGSVTLRPGDHVEVGQEIGRCGNSGRSHEPHVHMHVQDRQGFPFAQGMPISFTDYVADGARVARGMPRGETAFDAGDGQVVDATGDHDKVATAQRSE